MWCLAVYYLALLQWVSCYAAFPSHPSCLITFLSPGNLRVSVFHIFVLFFFFVWGGGGAGSQCSPGWLGTQAGLKVTEVHLPVLGLEACATTSNNPDNVRKHTLPLFKTLNSKELRVAKNNNIKQISEYMFSLRKIPGRNNHK